MVINIVIRAIEVAFRKFYRFHLNATQLRNELVTLSIIDVADVTLLLLYRVRVVTVIITAELDR